mgnify:CR=1 FL=1
MCGIAGYITDNKVSKKDICLMTSVLHHRGPDGEGHYYGNGFAFGHTRLSIVDLTDAGSQPMHYLDRYVITYNGEIYNHRELRIELVGAGYSFTSNTDTEVIMAAYDYWGVSCVEKFNGMWAMAIYDKKTEEFFLSRDRFGIKPFYYYQEDGRFVFASEVKAIMQCVESIRPNDKYLEQYLKQGPREYGTETAFDGVLRFPSSSYFLGKATELYSKFETIKYWKLEANLRAEVFCTNRAKKLAETYYELLSDAVSIRLRADVQVGSALSGGLDSSSIVYLVNKQLKKLGRKNLQKTFSSVYKTKGTEDCDESKFINLLADDLNVESYQIEPYAGNIPEEHLKMLWNMETPPESTCMSGWYTFKKVKEEGVTVTLDGQGADEQLAGYLYYVPTYLLSISLLDYYKEFKRFWRIPGIKRQLLLSIPLVHVKFFMGDTILSKLVYFVKKRKVHTNLNKQLEESIQTSLSTLIHYSDHVSMGHSIESRMPFMDYRLVEFLASVPACYKMHNGWTKYLARLAFDGKLPDDIVWRVDKLGWEIPEKHWFSGPLASWLGSELNEKELDVKNKTKNPHQLKTMIRMLNIKRMREMFFTESER